MFRKILSPEILNKTFMAVYIYQRLLYGALCTQYRFLRGLVRLVPTTQGEPEISAALGYQTDFRNARTSRRDPIDR